MAACDSALPANADATDANLIYYSKSKVIRNGILLYRVCNKRGRYYDDAKLQNRLLDLIYIPLILETSAVFPCMYLFVSLRHKTFG